MRTPNKSELAELEAEYESEREEDAASVDESFVCFRLIAFPTLRAWLAEREIEAPPPDIDDPYVARRLAEYSAFKANAFRRILPGPNRDSVERHFITFDDWLHGCEVHEMCFPDEPNPSIVAAEAEEKYPPTPKRKKRK
jgi:hypothetical protein